MLKKALFLAILSVSFTTSVHAAPYYRQESSLVPKDSTENIGTSTNRWDEGWFNSLNVTNCSGCSSASTTLLIDNNRFSGANIFDNITRSTTTQATTTNFHVSTAINLMGEVITNFTAYVRALFTGGDHITITAGDIDVDDDFLLNTGDVGTGAYDFGGASDFEIPNGTAPTVNSAGEIAVDTTSGQLKWYDGTKTQLVTGTTTKSFNIASTTLDALGNKFNTATSTFLLANFPEPTTMTGFYCTASSTGTALVRFGDPSGNYTQEGSCSTGSLTNVSSNNTWTAFEGLTLQASSTAGTVSRITVTAIFNKTAD